MLCKYKDVLGKVGEGPHSYRFFNVAVVDVGLTVLAGFLIHWFLPKYKLDTILIVLFGLGIVLHHMFCVRTTVDKFLFP
jgi:hypothetical protein